MARTIATLVLLTSVSASLSAEERLVATRVKALSVTESGFGNSDDVVWFVFGKDSNGDVFETRSPENGDIEFDEGTERKGPDLLDLKQVRSKGPGYATEFLIQMVEEDQKRAEEYKNQARAWFKNRAVRRFASSADEASARGSEIERRIIEEIIKALVTLGVDAIRNDSDEPLGTAFVRIVNDNGQVRAYWQAMDGCTVVNTEANQATFRMDYPDHDGDYEVVYDILSP